MCSVRLAAAPGSCGRGNGAKQPSWKTTVFPGERDRFEKEQITWSVEWDQPATRIGGLFDAVDDGFRHRIMYQTPFRQDFLVGAILDHGVERACKSIP